MKNFNTKKIALAGILIAVAVAGSVISIPVGVTRCSPVQHLVNILAAVLLGPWYGVAMAFITSCLRLCFGLGTLLAFPGSMVGALLSGILYKAFKKLPFACIGEMFGTGILGAMAAWPIVVYVLGREAAVFTYVIPFLVSSAGGTVIAVAVLLSLGKTGVISSLNRSLSPSGSAQ